MGQPWRTRGTGSFADSFSPLVFVGPIYLIRYVDITKKKGGLSLVPSNCAATEGKEKEGKKEKKDPYTTLSVANNEMKGQEKKKRHVHPSWYRSTSVGYRVVTRVEAKDSAG
jgi:hypothetical protein